MNFVICLAALFFLMAIGVALIWFFPQIVTVLPTQMKR